MARKAFWFIYHAGVVGLLAGVLFGLYEFAFSRSAGKAVWTGVIFAIFMGLAMAFAIQRSWPEGTTLSFADRTAVMRSVRRGEKVTDPRLAPAILSCVQTIRHGPIRDQRLYWILWLPFGLTVFGAVRATVTFTTHQAVTGWIISALWVSLLLRWPRIIERRIRNAEIAEAAARSILTEPPSY